MAGLPVTEIRAKQSLLQPLIGKDAWQFIAAMLDQTPVLDLDTYVRLFVRRRQLVRNWLEFLGRYPVIVSPVWTRPAFPNGWDVAGAEQSRQTFELLRPALPANLLGLPAAATPAGLAGGMPVGVQCMAARFREDRALDVAAVIQRAIGHLTPVDPFVNGA